MSNPFVNEKGIGAVDAESRISMIKDFTEKQLVSALCVPNIQKTVTRKILRRLRKLESEKGVVAHG